MRRQKGATHGHTIDWRLDSLASQAYDGDCQDYMERKYQASSTDSGKDEVQRWCGKGLADGQ